MGRKEARYKAIADVGPIALAIVENPAQNDALKWLNKVLKGEIRCVIPLSSIMGAFIVAVHYLRARPDDVADKLYSLVGIGEALWFSDLSLNRVRRSMRIAKNYLIDSWDAYLVTIMHDLGLRIVYTTDVNDFAKIEEIEPINPITEEKFAKLQKWLESRKQYTL